MAFRGLSLGGGQDSGGCIVISFSIPPGLESEAGLDVLACLADGLEVCLGDDSDEGSEGMTSFRRMQSGLVIQVGGHGWQSDWKPTDDVGVLDAVRELAAHNRNGQGQLIRYKGRE